MTPEREEALMDYIEYLRAYVCDLAYHTPMATLPQTYGQFCVSRDRDLAIEINRQKKAAQ